MEMSAIGATTSAIPTVQRFVRKLKATQPQRVGRMEARPGEEVQVDSVWAPTLTMERADHDLVEPSRPVPLSACGA